MRAMIRPSPHDVLKALDEIHPGAREIALRRSRLLSDVSIRRVAMAVMQAFGHSSGAVGRALSRDHATVLAVVAAFKRRQAGQLSNWDEELELFQSVLWASIDVAQRRANIIPFRRAA